MEKNKLVDAFKADKRQLRRLRCPYRGQLRLRVNKILDFILMILLFIFWYSLLQLLHSLKDLSDKPSVTLTSTVFGVVSHPLADLNVSGLKLRFAYRTLVLFFYQRLHHSRQTCGSFIVAIEQLQVLLADNLRPFYPILFHRFLSSSHC